MILMNLPRTEFTDKRTGMPETSCNPVYCVFLPKMKFIGFRQRIHIISQPADNPLFVVVSFLIRFQQFLLYFRRHFFITGKGHRERSTPAGNGTQGRGVTLHFL